MSEADNLTKLRTTVEIYEKELQNKGTSISELRESYASNDSEPNARVLTNELLNALDIVDKLLNAYKEYVQAIEKLIPR